jgi:hypothetical protein
MDARTRRIVGAAQRSSGGSLLTVVAGTGETAPPGSAPATDLLAVVGIADSAGGGRHGGRRLFLDGVLAKRGSPGRS